MPGSIRLHLRFSQHFSPCHIFPSPFVKVVSEDRQTHWGIELTSAKQRKEACMFTAYIIVTIVAAGANIYAATSDFVRPEWLLGNMSKLGVPESWLPILGVLKAAGALGLLIGIGVPLIGIAAAAGLTLFFIGAVITHLRAHDLSLGNGVPVMFLVVVLAALALGIYGRGTVI
jgi:DoxX-like family